jgi:hypothetical protein
MTASVRTPVLVHLSLALGLCLATGLLLFVSPKPSGFTLAWSWAATGSLVASTGIALRYFGRTNGPTWTQTAALLFLAILSTAFSFAATYYTVDLPTQDVSKDACKSVQFTECLNRESALYFTVATLSTVGFGDIAPAGRRARRIATFQMVTGVAMLSLGVGRLLGATTSERGSAPTSDAPS